MRLASQTRLAKRLALGALLFVGGLALLHFWIIPAVIVSQIQARLEGKVTIRGWWVNGRSAGVRGLTIHEGPRQNSPVWITVDRVATDLNLGGLLRGRFSPARVDVIAPRVTFRMDQEGHFLNLPKVKGGSSSTGAIPAIMTKAARVSFRREGRPLDMVVSGVQASLHPNAQGDALKLSGIANDPFWGRWKAQGTLGVNCVQGEIEFSGDNIVTNPEKLARVLFIPTEVWSHVAPSGAVDLSVGLHWVSKPQPTLHTRTLVKLLGTSAQFPSLELATTETTGTIEVDDGVVRIQSVQGQTMAGHVEASGTLDFTQTPSQVALDLNLKKVDVVKTPKSWQLSEAAITGFLTGKVQLRALLDPSGVDLSGSSGTAIVEGGTVQGIPVKSLRLAMHAQGRDLQYDTKSPDSASRRLGPPHSRTRSRLSLRVDDTGGTIIPVAWTGETQGPPKWQDAQAPAAPKEPEPNRGGLHLPKSITTQIELEDVNIQQLIARGQYLFGVSFPLPISGKLSLKADATIPLGALGNVKDYAFHGDLTLTGASIARVDFGRLLAHVDFASGVLELKKLRGLLVNRPDGGPDNPPPASALEIPKEGAMPAGGFRCDLRAEIAPLGRLSGVFEGNQLPVGELAAPLLPRPTPLGGLMTLNFDAASDLKSITVPQAWTASGKAESLQLTYKSAALDRVSFDFGLKESHLSIPRLEAKLNDRPLSSRLELDLNAPYAYSGALDVSGWDLAKLDALISVASQPLPVAGNLTVHATSKGTLSPRSIESQGQGEIVDFKAENIPLGRVPFRWTSEKDTIVLSGVEAQPFGGQIKADARIPITLDKPIEGFATVSGIDTAQLTQAIPHREITMSGKADGRAAFSVRPDLRQVDANIHLTAPNLVIQGLATEKLIALLQAQDGHVKYEITAESLGGRIKFLGNFPWKFAQEPPNPSAPSANATGELRVVGFTLEQVWKTLGISGSLEQFSGRGALNANIRDVFAGNDKGLWASGIIEFRDLNWSNKLPLGQLRGIVDKSPTAWKIDPITGAMFGGSASGAAWGTTPAKEPARSGFRFRVDRAALRQLLAPWPDLARNVSGAATIRLSGAQDQTFTANGDVQLSDARFGGLPMSELRFPADFVFTPESGLGVLQLRQASVRLAGGQIRGDGSFRVGKDRSFHTQLQLAGVDIQTLAKLSSDASRGTSGRINGRITLFGPDLAASQRYRGKLDLDLDDASLITIPIFREIDRFLGAARGGLFEDGDLSGTIANRQLVVESLTLQGRIVQLHAAGTVGFDSQLNLEVLINTNQIIPETGQALVGLIPGLRDVIGRREQAQLRVANYLANRLLKLRVTGTLKNPSVVLDSSIPVANAAVGFFSGVLKLPLGFIK